MNVNDPDSSMRSGYSGLSIAPSGLTLQSPLGSQLGQRSGLHFADPKRLLHPSRFDVMVKLLFARSVLGLRSKASESSIRALYRQHIMTRTGAREPYRGDSKGTLHDFEAFFVELIRDMSRTGFDLGNPVQISGTSGQILNGAHRLAAAVALQIKEVSFRIDDVTQGRAWDLQWFRENGFRPENLDLMKSIWLELRPPYAKLIIIWPPAVNNLGLLHHTLRQRGVELLDLQFYELKAGFREFVKDVYSFQHGVAIEKLAPHICQKAARLEVVGSRVGVALVNFPEDNAAPPLANFKATKADLRAEVQVEGLPLEDTIHMADSFSEEAFLSNLVLNRTNMKSYSVLPPLRVQLTAKLESLLKTLKFRGIPQDKVCLVGGSVFDLWGIKRSDDLDIVLASDVRRKMFGPAPERLSRDVDLVSENFFRQLPVEDRLDLSDNALIDYPEHHIFRRGFKFADLGLVVEKKRFSRRPKDLQDLKLLGVYWSREPPPKSRFDETPMGGMPAPPRALRLETANQPDVNPRVLLRQADNAHQSGELSHAAKLYKRALSENPDDPYALCGLGLLALHRGDLYVALNYFEQSLRVKSDNSAAELGKQQVEFELRQQTGFSSK